MQFYFFFFSFVHLKRYLQAIVRCVPVPSVPQRTVPQSCITNCFVLTRHHCACLSDQSQLWFALLVVIFVAVVVGCIAFCVDFPGSRTLCIVQFKL